MDKFVLKVMQYLDNPELFTEDEMWEDAYNAWAVADAATNANAYAVAATVGSAAHAAYAYADAEYWLDKYFKITGEDKQGYINEVERLR